MKFYKGIWQNRQRLRITEKRQQEMSSTAISNPFAYASYLKKDLEKSTHLLESIHQKENSDKEQTLQENMLNLRSLINAPKDSSFDERASEIQSSIGDAEAHETIRQERWNPDIYCPLCHSSAVIRLEKSLQDSANNYKYKCLSCESRFSDDSQMEASKGQPPITVWIQCWYLLGCTNSVEKIAEKLNLDIRLVEHMVNELQRSFKTKQPQISNKGKHNWAQHREIFKKKVAEVIAERKNELYGGNIVNQARDTAEERRQKVRKRTLKNRNF